MTDVSGVALRPFSHMRRPCSLGGVALLAIAIMLTSIVAMAPSAGAATVTTLYSFCAKANCPDGDNPATVIQGTDGNLYGLALDGGSNFGGEFFKLSLGGTFSGLYGFCGTSTCLTDGYSLVGDLLQAPDGNFYGAQLLGGTRGKNGTIFKLSPSGSRTALVDMTAKFSHPEGLIFDAADNLFYGFSQTQQSADARIFSVTPTGATKLVYSFCSAPDCPDGNGPASMVQGTDGNFYGATLSGGNAPNCTYGCGTIFKVTPGGDLTTLYSVCPSGGCHDMFDPVLALQGTDGNFYGFTKFGGPANNDPQCSGIGCGTIFKITPEGKFTRLYSFCSQANCTDGVIPESLIQGSDGNLYGTTYAGGSNTNKSMCNGDQGADSCGTLFMLTPSGILTTLYNFCSKAKCADGQTPISLMQDTNGDFYGTAESVVFHLSTGLGPFVKTQVAVAKAGVSVAIIGTNLTGATSVTFNGTAASFAVNSASEITATVPSGATTGYIKVVTPGGTLQSSAKFGVSP